MKRQSRPHDVSTLVDLIGKKDLRSNYMARQRKRVMRKRPRKAAVKRQPRMLVYPIQRKRNWQMASDENLVTGTTTARGARSFTLNKLNNFAEFTKLFDQFTIVKVDMHCIPRINNNNAGLPQQCSNFHYVKDYTDDTVPAANTSVWEYQGCKTINVQGSTGFHISIKPRIASAQWAGAANPSSYSVQKANTFISTEGSGPATSHYVAVLHLLLQERPMLLFLLP